MKIINFFKSFGIILLYLLLGTIVGVYTKYLGLSNPLVNQIVLILGELLVLIVIAYILKDKLSGQIENFKKNYKEYLPKALKYWATGFAFMIVLNVLILFLIPSGIAPNEEANRELMKIYPLYSIISAGLIAPISEELIFRLNFKNVIKSRIPFVLVTGLLFGAAHIMVSSSLFELIYILPYSALGIAFSLGFYDTDNIMTSISMHAFHNIASLIIIFSML